MASSSSEVKRKPPKKLLSMEIVSFIYMYFVGITLNIETVNNYRNCSTF